MKCGGGGWRVDGGVGRVGGGVVVVVMVVVMEGGFSVVCTGYSRCFCARDSDADGNGGGGGDGDADGNGDVGGDGGDGGELILRVMLREIPRVCQHGNVSLGLRLPTTHRSIR